MKNYPKQVLVVRKDLHMRSGKIAAQCSHASMSFITRRMWPDKIAKAFNEPCNRWHIEFTKVEEEWLEKHFTKVCLYVNSEQELEDICIKAKAAGLECHAIIDDGTTEFHGVPTLTCCAIGPDYAEKIDPITGHLKLL